MVNIHLQILQMVDSKRVSWWPDKRWSRHGYRNVWNDTGLWRLQDESDPDTNTQVYKLDLKYFKNKENPKHQKDLEKN